MIIVLVRLYLYTVTNVVKLIIIPEIQRLKMAKWLFGEFTIR